MFHTRVTDFAHIRTPNAIRCIVIQPSDQHFHYSSCVEFRARNHFKETGDIIIHSFMGQLHLSSQRHKRQLFKPPPFVTSPSKSRAQVHPFHITQGENSTTVQVLHQECSNTQKILLNTKPCGWQRHSNFPMKYHFYPVTKTTFDTMI